MTQLLSVKQGGETDGNEDTESRYNDLVQRLLKLLDELEDEYDLEEGWQDFRRSLETTIITHGDELVGAFPNDLNQQNNGGSNQQPGNIESSGSVDNAEESGLNPVGNNSPVIDLGDDAPVNPSAAEQTGTTLNPVEAAHSFDLPNTTEDEEEEEEVVSQPSEQDSLSLESESTSQ
jgi:hypothetical protein